VINLILKNILTVISLFLFISSEILYTTYSSITCNSEVCCRIDCCEESECCDNPLENTFSSENNCCDINEGIQSNFEKSVIYNSHSNIKAPIIFNHTNNTSIKETNKLHSGEYSVKPPMSRNLIPALRI